MGLGWAGLGQGSGCWGLSTEDSLGHMPMIEAVGSQTGLGGQA